MLLLYLFYILIIFLLYCFVNAFKLTSYLLFKKKKFPKLTSREIDILNILWENEKPLIASEIADARSDLTINTVQAVLRKLLKYQLVEVADIVYSGTVLSRSYRPTITSEEFAVQELTSDYLAFQKTVSKPLLVSALFGYRRRSC